MADQGHCIQFHNTSIFTTKASNMDCIFREVIEIELHPYDMNSKNGIFSRNPVTLSFSPLKIFWDIPDPRGPDTIDSPFSDIIENTSEATSSIIP
jgi:hypothetical protein